MEGVKPSLTREVLIDADAKKEQSIRVVQGESFFDTVASIYLHRPSVIALKA